MVTNSRLLIITFILISGLNSCSFTHGVSPGIAVFRGFSLVTSRPDPIDWVWRSTLRSLDSLKIKATKRKHDSNKGTIIGVTRQDNSVKITMKKVNGNTTRIGIRVGVFGDEDLSREIMRRIDQHLEFFRYEIIRERN